MDNEPVDIVIFVRAVRTLELQTRDKLGTPPGHVLCIGPHLRQRQLIQEDLIGRSAETIRQLGCCYASDLPH